MSWVISPPKNVSSSHVPKPTSADVAARRTSTDSSSPNASQSATYRNVTISQSDEPQELLGARARSRGG